MGIMAGDCLGQDGGPVLARVRNFVGLLLLHTEGGRAEGVPLAVAQLSLLRAARQDGVNVLHNRHALDTHQPQPSVHESIDVETPTFMTSLELRSAECRDADQNQGHNHGDCKL